MDRLVNIHNLTRPRLPRPIIVAGAARDPCRGRDHPASLDPWRCLPPATCQCVLPRSAEPPAGEAVTAAISGDPLARVLR